MGLLYFVDHPVSLTMPRLSRAVNKKTMRRQDDDKVATGRGLLTLDRSCRSTQYNSPQPNPTPPTYPTFRPVTLHVSFVILFGPPPTRAN